MSANKGFRQRNTIPEEAHLEMLQEVKGCKSNQGVKLREVHLEMLQEVKGSKGNRGVKVGVVESEWGEEREHQPAKDMNREIPYLRWRRQGRACLKTLQEVKGSKSNQGVKLVKAREVHLELETLQEVENSK
ncbi:hypothetical protein H4582DRAFT_2059915 [Lactarius indigo]|nr:hypothetical protein H4582DRAFT_2059915 [Lactarius indigo]